MMLTKASVKDEKEWDVFGLMFENVVALAEDIVELDLKTTAKSDPYCINMAIVGILFQVCLSSNLSFTSPKPREQ